jgi:osmotically-inducible protein OsmY
MNSTLNPIDSLAAVSDAELSQQNHTVGQITLHLQSEFYHKVDNALKSHPNLPRNQLRFEVAAGRVVLQGRVQSYFQKQMAQEALRRIHGVEQIDNQVEVVWS